jgi:two-component system phosphate regulon response regulator PhoB
VQILALRKKLGQAGEMIETIRGVGYRFKET